MLEGYAQFLDLHQVVDDSPVPLSVADLTGAFVLVNQAFARMTGYTKEELLSQTYQSMTHPDDLPAAVELGRRLCAGEIRNASYEKRYLRKDGGVVWVWNWLSAVRDTQGMVTHTVALSESVAQRTLMQAPRSTEDGVQRRGSTYLLHFQDDESRRFASELHDSTAQLLAGMTLVLTQLRELESVSSLQRELTLKALDLATQCSREIRGLAYRLYPPLLEELGLAGALETYLESFRRNTGTEVILNVAADFGRLPLDWEMTIFRVVQEGLANAFKHSGSPVAWVTLARNRQEATMELRDRGRGFSAASGGAAGAHFGLGIRSMYERVRLLGGDLQITSGREGTRIHLKLALDEAHGEISHSVGR